MYEGTFVDGAPRCNSTPWYDTTLLQTSDTDSVLFSHNTVFN